jgi:hypothetical protein
MKTIAIDAEREQALAGDHTAFRLGILYAISQLTGMAQEQIKQGMPDEAFTFYNDATEWLFMLHDHLYTVDNPR